MLLHDLITKSAAAIGGAPALLFRDQVMDYDTLAQSVADIAQDLLALDLAARERVAVYLDKRPETIAALFGATAAGGVFVPVNPLLKPEQVGYILRDCNVRILVTSADRVRVLCDELRECPDLHTVLVVGTMPVDLDSGHVRLVGWNEATPANDAPIAHPAIDTDMAAILYTSGSTGRPKGVVLSHRAMVAGAHSVAQYLDNRANDRLLAALPLSFDYGLSQFTTAFSVGASVALLNWLMPRDVIRAVEKYRITGLAAVPPLWIQLAQLDWPTKSGTHLRYLTNSGGHMPRTTLDALRGKLPGAQCFLMYGLTEAFRSTYLPPEEIDRRPDSIGKAIPNTEILVVREDGSPCTPGEPGELVHRGALVGLGYWNAPDLTAQRFRPTPGQPDGLTLPEIAVWSGDTVRADDEGYLYFVGRRDEMIKTSGYRVSPDEIEEVAYGTGLVAEAVALGVTHPILGQGIVLVATPKTGTDPETLLTALKPHLPAFMVPHHVELRDTALPRNANGKIDRKQLREDHEGLFEDTSPS